MLPRPLLTLTNETWYYLKRTTLIPYYSYLLSWENTVEQPERCCTVTSELLLSVFGMLFCK